MNFYEILIPQITLLLGIVVIIAIEVWGEDGQTDYQWLAHLFVLVLATIQQVLLYRIPSLLYLRGGMVLDGVSQALSLSILLLALLVQVWRRKKSKFLTAQANLLSLGATFFALFAVQTNRMLFGVMAIIALVWTGLGALVAETKGDEQPTYIHSAIVRSLGVLLTGTILCLVCFATFGETQIDEIQRVVARPNLNGAAVACIQILIIFLGALVMGLPPFQGLLGGARKKSSWPLAVGLTGIFSIVGLSIFLRWALVVFSRPAIGGLELEPLTSADIFLDIRVIASVGLVLVPLLTLLSNDLRGGFLYFMLNPFVQTLFALSFGQRETFGFAMGQVLSSVLSFGLLISAVETLALAPGASWDVWSGIGRRHLIGAIFVIFSMMAAAGLSPFYGSLLLYKTLCINSWFGIFLLINIGLGGFYVARLTTLAFQKGNIQTTPPATIAGGFRMGIFAQFALLIFMGIFWESLYKYGAFSIRNFFGDI